MLALPNGRRRPKNKERAAKVPKVKSIKFSISYIFLEFIVHVIVKGILLGCSVRCSEKQMLKSPVKLLI